ncbi:hypothetical protein LTR66_001427 [Elasticomyces elasticus]|nr:hypothetical protein LTR50_005772 [Elasticomyces elasticus]KAK4999547.1 hypothetical protein LTR66_001427 [Elasticomyces elasticus]
MLSLLLASLLAIPIVSAAPTHALRPRFIEETPWRLSDIAAFEAAPGPSGVSSISFHFCDTNTGIEIETDCSRYLTPGSGASAVDPDNYYSCDDPSVAFKFLGDSIAVERIYKDPSVGPPGMDVVTAFGNANTSLKSDTTAEGTTSYQQALDVKITALIAK